MHLFAANQPFRNNLKRRQSKLKGSHRRHTCEVSMHFQSVNWKTVTNVARESAFTPAWLPFLWYIMRLFRLQIRPTSYKDHIQAHLFHLLVYNGPDGES